MRGVFREDCLSLCYLQASSAAAEQIVSDEGTPVLFTGVGPSLINVGGGIFLVTLLLL